jgi:hypothetical protein
MAFLYSFAAPRSRPLPLESLAPASTMGGLINAVGSFFSSSSSASSSKAGQAASASGEAASAGASGGPEPDLLSQVVPSSASPNLRLASKARAHLMTTLQTSLAVDKDIELKRLEALRNYMPFARTMHEQWAAVSDNKAELERLDRAVGGASGGVQWSSVLQVGARPNAKDEVPFFSYGRLDLGEELAHVYLTYGLTLYQRAGALSFHALQLALTIPPCGVLNLLPWYAAECAAQGGDEEVVASAAAPKKPMFNPLSYVAPAPARGEGGSAPPKSANEIASIRAAVISKRKEAVELLRRAAGVFEFLRTDFLPNLPLPSNNRARMLDTMPAISHALHLLALVHCQQHTILSALLALSPGSTSPPPSPALLAKLCQGIVDKVSEVKRVLRSGSGSYFHAIEPSVHVWLRASENLYRGLRIIALAMQAEVGDEEHGLALALLSGAEKLLTQLTSNDPARGLPLASIRDCNPVLSELKGHAVRLGSEVRRVITRLERDNNKIYFDKVPEKFEEALLAAGEPPQAAKSLAAIVAGTPLPDDAPSIPKPKAAAVAASSSPAVASAASLQPAAASAATITGVAEEDDDDASERAAAVFLPSALPFDPPPVLQALFITTGANSSTSGGGANAGSSTGAAAAAAGATAP